MAEPVQKKYEKLLDTIRPYVQAVVAFSGGVDSTLLAYAAAAALGRENIICVTARSDLMPARECKEAAIFCEAFDLRHEILDFDEMKLAGFADNPPNRCYLCKYDIFSRMGSYAYEMGMDVVFEGSNADDTGDYRPGMRALAELDVKSPLLDAGLSKDDIRAISRELGLETWDKPSFACLASRFAYGERITAEKLAMVDKAEQFLFDKGYHFVRVRIHGNEYYTARIEARPEDIADLAAAPIRADLAAYFNSLGFTYTALDLTGYRTGSMNEVLTDQIV